MKRICTNGDEQDAYSPWRKYIFAKAGQVKRIKKRTHKRERHEARRWINEQLED